MIDKIKRKKSVENPKEAWKDVIAKVLNERRMTWVR